MNTFENIIKHFGEVLVVILCCPLYLLPFYSQMILYGILRYPINFKPNLISTMPTPWFVVLMVFLGLFQIYLFIAMADSNHYQTRKLYWRRMVLLLFTGFEYDYVYDEEEYLLKQVFDHLSYDCIQGCEEKITECILKDMTQKFSLSKNEKEDLENALKLLAKKVLTF